ncbi:shikimate dehydrogenase [Planomicrobium sp. YIM 101495]|uniref:shikimate dehydrogenase n=1 Tax=Planomicrobium sp. YIM 101495 TaxID=2665160 RepID=UPI0013F72288|nr:shikimate dehydrogenase [Planomicrobium sp. YIM 101495]
MKKWYAVIGDPIAHSLSPYMHDAWFQESSIDASYIPVHLEPSELEDGFHALKKIGVSGFNVTLPHKQAIIPFLDGLDDTARTMNAVNTVVMKDGKSYGYNTDGDGFVQSLFALPVDREQPLLVIGAGGAARGIVHALHRAGFTRLTVTNRTFRRAEELAGEVGAEVMTISQAEAELGTFHTIVQTTSVGLSDNESLPLSVEWLKPGTVVADIVYNPLVTPLLKVASDKGCKTINGVGMFVHQGAIAFEKWTGKTPNQEAMIDSITQKLGGNNVNR